MNKSYFFIIVLLFVSFAYAEPSFFYKSGVTVDLKIPCINNNTACSASALCNMTIQYPNGSNYVKEQPMSYQDSYFNYTLTDGSVKGEYQSSMFCVDGSKQGYSIFSFMINNSGDNEKPSGIIVVVILIPLLLSIFFIVGGVTLNDEHNALRIFLFLLSLMSFFVSAYLAAVNIVKFYVFSELEDALSISVYIFAIIIFVIMTYFIIYLIYKTIHHIAEQKKERLEY